MNKDIKILASEPVTKVEPFPHWKFLKNIVSEAGRPGTTVDFISLKGGYSFQTSPYTRAYNVVKMAQKAYQAEKKGYDAFLVSCASDTGLRECRAIANIPIVAPTESAALLASTLGHKFSIIISDPINRPVAENAVRNAGVADKIASIRCPENVTPEEISRWTYENPEKMIDVITSEMAKAVKEDGAEVLWIASVPAGSVLSLNKVFEVEGATVINIFTAALKLAEIMVDMKRTYGTHTCKKTIYLAPREGWEKEIPIEID
jgi:allantoin racemase